MIVQIILPCLISNGHISSKGCISENATGKLASICNGYLHVSDEVYLKSVKRKILLL